MFCNFCKSMATCVMAFILLTGCAERGRTARTAVCTDSSAESVLWSDFRQEDSTSGQVSPVQENKAGEGTVKQEQEHSADSADCGPDAHMQEGEAGKTGDDEAYTDKDGSFETPGLYVDVCGAVNSPGVVMVPEGARVYEAIEKAGGLSADADGRYVNQARKLTDGEQIYVPAKDETDGQAWQFGSEGPGGENRAALPNTGTENPGGASSGGGGATGVNADGKVNINTADSATLQTLTGIGESRAEAIILYRETNGAFETIEDIMKVTGIKNALFNNIRNDITV